MQGPTSPEEDPSDQVSPSGGWAAPYWAEVMAQAREEAMAAPYDILFGRKTYELFAGHFGGNGGDDLESRRLSEATKYVATSTLTAFPWQPAVPLTGDIPTSVKRLKAEDGPLIQVHGSCALIQTLLAHDLVDEFRLWTFPVVVGSGQRLFGPQTKPADLALVKSAQCPNGAVMTIYRRASPSATR